MEHFHILNAGLITLWVLLGATPQTVAGSCGDWFAPLKGGEVIETRNGFWVFRKGQSAFYRDSGQTVASVFVEDASHLEILRRQLGEARYEKILASRHPGRAVDKAIDERVTKKFEAAGLLATANRIREQILQVPGNRPIPTRWVEQGLSALVEMGLGAPTFKRFIHRQIELRGIEAVSSGQFAGNYGPIEAKWARVEVVIGSIEERVRSGRAAMPKTSILVTAAHLGYSEYQHSELRLAIQHVFGASRCPYPDSTRYQNGELVVDETDTSGAAFVPLVERGFLVIDLKQTGRNLKGRIEVQDLSHAPKAESTEDFSGPAGPNPVF